MPRETKLQETSTRKKVDKILENLGWINDEENPDCNVTTEVPKLLKQKEKLNRDEGDYFLYKSGTDEIIAVIETKRPNESIKQALNQGIKKYAEPLGVPIVFATDGNIVRTYHLRDMSELKKDGIAISMLLSELDLLKFQKNAEISTPVEVKYTKQELIKIFERANELLRKDGLREGIERFTEFANLLFMKMINEIEDEREKQGIARRFEKRYCWDYYKDWDGQRILDYINDSILPKLADKYNHSGDVFQRRLNIKNPDTIKEIVDRLSKLNLLVIESDVKGDAFEYFLKESVSVGNDLGEYFTPRHIVKLMVQLVDPVFGETVYDSSCGTGGFLIEAYKHLWEKCKHTKENVEFLQEKTIYGRELTGTAKIAKMNMILAGDGHTNIKQMDSLSKPINGEYDIVLTNFPFSQETDYGNLYGMNTKDANGVFLKHIITSLKDGGRAGVVCFQGVLFDSRYRDIREYLLKNCDLEAVIKLHRYTFQPYANVDTSILIFKKGKPTKKVWFFNVEEDGFKKTSSKKGRAIIEETDIPTLLDLWDKKESSEKSWSVDINKIISEDYSLSVEKYKPQTVHKTSYLKVLLSEICETRLGKTPAKNQYNNKGQGHKIIKYRDITEDGQILWGNNEEGYIESSLINDNFRTVEEGDLLVVASGHSPESIGSKMALVKLPENIVKPIYFVGEIMSIRVKDKNVVSPDYLYYYFRHTKGNIALRNAIEGVHLTQGRAGKIEVILPPITEQNEIVQNLNKQDSLIKSAFNTLRFLEEAGIDETFFKSETKIKLKEVADVNPRYKINANSKCLYVDMSSIDEFTGKIKKFKKRVNEGSGLSRFADGDILLGRITPCTENGKVAIVNNLNGEIGLGSTEFIVISPKLADRDWLYFYFKVNSTKNKLVTSMRGATGRQRVPVEFVMDLDIPKIEPEKQKEIANTLQSYFRTKEGLREVISLSERAIEDTMNNVFEKV